MDDNKQARIKLLVQIGVPYEDALMTDDVALHAAETAMTALTTVIDTLPPNLRLNAAIIATKLFIVNAQEALDELPSMMARKMGDRK